MRSAKLLGVLPMIMVFGCSSKTPTAHVKEAWNDANDPLILQGDFNRTFTALPVSGQLAVLPWSDTYWPSYIGGIAQRWHNAPDDQFAYRSPTEEQVGNMSLADLADLSPAEKYDIYNGRFDYPTVSRERNRVSPTNATWEGICHGWAPAAINFAEPKPVAVTGDSGVQVPFGSSDVKALLSYYQGELSDASSQLLGTRCDIDLAKHPNAATTNPECKGINAGAFHVALTNLIGLQHTGFVADVSHGDQIWNQPVYGYKTTVGKSQPPSAGASPDAVSEVSVHTEMNYTQEVDPSWDAHNGTDGFGSNTANYDYRLELDGDGNIVGGAWVSTDLPDFIWTEGAPSFDGYYGKIQSVFKASLKGPLLAEPGN